MPQAKTAFQVRDALRQRGVLEEVEKLIAGNAVTLEEVTGTTKMWHVARLRRKVWWVLYTKYKMSYPAIAEVFGKNHTTIMDGVKKHAESKDDEG